MTKIDLLILGGSALFVIVLIAALVWWRKRPKALKVEYYYGQWQSLQKMLRDKTKWAKAVVDADSLLDKALKKKHVGGHNMGERLVQAQRLLTDNDSVWFGHKLRNKIDSNPKIRLKEADVKQALIGFRQALKDIGALPDGQPRSTQ